VYKTPSTLLKLAREFCSTAAFVLASSIADSQTPSADALMPFPLQVKQSKLSHRFKKK
jgi:hypothetical protein